MILQNIKTYNFESLTEQELTACKILVVDDEPSIRIVLQEILVEVGYDLEELDSGEKAISRMKESPPDLVLLDVMMPGIDGFEACRKIRKDKDLQEIPIIFITGLDKNESLLEAFDAGANDYLTKPFSENEVRVRVRNHLRLKKAIDKLKLYSGDLEKLVEEEFRELIKSERQAAFGQLIQGIIHNLRGPLTAINAGLHTGRHTLKAAPFTKKDTEAQTFCDSISQSFDMVRIGSERLTEMINNMMSRSRSEHPGAFEVTDLNKIVREELTFLDADLKFKHEFKKDIRLAEQPLTVKAVPSELSQVVHNLIRNAMDAVHDHPEPIISIETDCLENTVLFTLGDNGQGIPPEHINHIFDPLFTTKPKAGEDTNDQDVPTGTGLGLYTCLWIIQSHHGSISVESEPGCGSVFQVALPAC